MGEQRKHHFVPRSYLQFFAKQKKKEYQIYVIDKTTNKLYLTNIDNVAAERDYNTVENEGFVFNTPDGDNLFYEKQYSQVIETDLPQIIRKTISICKLSIIGVRVIDNDLKKQLSKAIVIQMMRTPNTRSYFYGILERVFNSVMTPYYKMADLQLFNKEKYLATLNRIECTENFKKSAVLNALFDENRINSYAEVLENYYAWVLFENNNDEGVPFITSDEPVTICNPSGLELGLKNHGIALIDTNIGFPLSGSYYLMLYHLGRLDSDAIYNNINDRCQSLVSDTNFVRRLNSLQFNQCRRMVFCHPDACDIICSDLNINMKKRTYN